MTSSSPPIRVIKLGGSLLDLDDLSERLGRWLAVQSPRRSVMIVGGGSLADAVRAAYRRHALDEETAHWLCVRLLGVTAELVHRLMRGSRLATRYEAICDASATGELVLFESEQFLREVEPSLGFPPLPHTWNVTSDSIAARLAAALGARELVLLKSRLPATGLTTGDLTRKWPRLQSLVEEGYVDDYFPHATCGLVIRAVNLRDPAFTECSITTGQEVPPGAAAPGALG
jgi:aspartokinase-like uncharacterized kinase